MNRRSIMPLSDEELGYIRIWFEDRRGVTGAYGRKLLATYDEQRAEVKRLRAQVAAVEAVCSEAEDVMSAPSWRLVTDINGNPFAPWVGTTEIRAALASEGDDHAAE